MWIEPNGVVKIINNVPLDKDYNNTLYFPNRTAQYNYFNSKVKYTYDKITYQRIERRYMKVEVNAENLYDCNYLMFQNSAFGNKWFYAFITKVEYSSNRVSIIEYEIDEIQTWFYDCTMLDSFVEREHSVTDEFGANRVDEGLELGEYIIKDAGHSGMFDGFKICVAKTIQPKPGGGYASCGVYPSMGMPIALNYAFYSFDASGLEALNIDLDALTDDMRHEAIFDCFLIPTVFQTALAGDPYAVKKLPFKVYMNQDIDGHTARNKKLLQAPFNVLTVTDLRGNVGEFSYEDFNDPINNGVDFEYSLSLSCDSSMQLVPLNHKGVAKDVNEQMVYKGYPHIAWNTDMYRAWLSQNGGIIPTMLKQVETIGGAVSTLGPQTTPLEAVGTFNKIHGSIMEFKRHQKQPPSAHGNHNGDVIFNAGHHDFYYIKQTIRREMAERIDDFFDMFGYATKKLKVPNISSRPHWNYVKTLEANIIGDIPADNLTNIKSIFNRGITFWKNGNEVGDYSLDNRPV